MRLKQAFGVLGATVFMLGASGTAHASSVTFTIDCTITGAGTCDAPTGSFGTISLVDDPGNSNWVDLTINLTTPPGRTINKFFLNVDPNLIPFAPGYAITATGSNVVASEDSEGQGLYGMVFDVVGSTGPAANPINTVLKLQKSGFADLNLDALNFDFTDTMYGKLYAAVNYSGTGPQEGASTSVVVSTTAQVVPEPATLTLVGLGFAGLARRRLRARG